MQRRAQVFALAGAARAALPPFQLRKLAALARLRILPPQGGRGFWGGGDAAKGLIIAAASSGSGKTTVTLALLALLKRRGVAVASCKVGPDYIDPQFHARATGRPCFNLDGWAMRPATLAHLVRQAAHDAELLVDRRRDGPVRRRTRRRRRWRRARPRRSRRCTDLPVVLVLRAKGIGATAAALLRGAEAASCRCPRRRRDLQRGRRRAASRDAGAGGRARGSAGAGLSAGVRATSRCRAAISVWCRRASMTRSTATSTGCARISRRISSSMRCAHLARAAVDRAIGASARDSAARPAHRGRATMSRSASAMRRPCLAGARRGRRSSASRHWPARRPDAMADAIFLPGGYPELHAGTARGERRLHGRLAGRPRARARRSTASVAAT